MRHSGHVNRPDGFVSLDVILSLRDIRKLNAGLDDIKTIVTNCLKGRFTLKCDNEVPNSQETEYGFWIRANQGHSSRIPVEDNALLQKISKPDGIPFAAHGSYMKYWDSIKRNGLLTLGRKHIHFSEKVHPGYEKFVPPRTFDHVVRASESKVVKSDEAKSRTEDVTIEESDDSSAGLKKLFIPGQRMNCDLLIFLNIDMCIKHNVPMYKSDNDVILVPGVSVEEAKRICDIEGHAYDPDLTVVSQCLGKRQAHQAGLHERDGTDPTNCERTLDSLNQAPTNTLATGRKNLPNMGVIPPLFFLKVVDLSTAQDLCV